MAAGRPSKYTNKLAIQICRRIANGESVRVISRDENMPAMSTIFKWLSEKELFSEQYIKAKHLQADYYAEEIISIADDSTNDYMEKEGNDGKVYEVLNHENIGRSRLRVDTRKWLMGKLRPKKYGEKTQLVGDGGGPIESKWTVEVIKSDTKDGENG